MYRCSNSSPRYSVRNHYAILVHSFENFLRSQNYKISITLLSFLICLGQGRAQSNAKVIKNSGNPLFPNDFLGVEMADGTRFWLLAVSFYLSSATFPDFIPTVCLPNCLALSGAAGGFVGRKTYTCSPETFRY